MCIIVYKSFGVEMPDYTIFENCFDKNHDGAGIMFRDNSGEIIIKKGYFDIWELYDAFDEIENEFDLKYLDLVIHFRLATTGKVCDENCHPFPITASISELKKCEIKCKIGVAHNGVISFCSNKKRSNLSDTQIFIKDYLSYLPYNQFDNLKALELIQIASKSKFVFMTKDNVNIIGDFILDNNIYYSNNSYKSKRKEWKFPRCLHQYECETCETFECVEITG